MASGAVSIGKVDVRINSAGARELLSSPAVRDLLDEKAQAMADAACALAPSPDGHDSPPFDHETRMGEDRWIATVYTKTKHGMNAQAKRNALTKALGSIGG